MKRNLKFFVLLSILAFVAACGIVINNEKFDSEKWKNGDARAKGKMVYDLQKSKVLLGKTKPEVTELSYKEPDIEKIRNSPTSNDWVFGIDTNVFLDIYFSVHFDEKTQKVISTDISD